MKSNKTESFIGEWIMGVERVQGVLLTLQKTHMSFLPYHPTNIQSDEKWKRV